MKWMGWIVCVVLMAGVVGCVPKRVVWSPDGTRAAVLGEDGLHVCDGEGKIGPMLVAGVRVAEWTPDGKRLIVVEEVVLKNWKEIEETFPGAFRVPNNPEELNYVRNGLVSYSGDWGNLEEGLNQKLGGGERHFDWDLIYLRDHEEGTLKEKLGKHWEALAGLTSKVARVRSYGISPEGRVLDAGPVLWYPMPRSDIMELRVSPDGRYVALTEADSKFELSRLTVFSVDGKTLGPDKSPAGQGIGEASMYCDWSPDGRSVIYIRPTGGAKMSGNQARFGTLSRMEVVTKDGKLKTDYDGEIPAEDLAGLLYDPMLRVRVGADGRIYFVSVEVTLPTTAADVLNKAQLFCMDPLKQGTVSRVVPRSELEDMGDAPQFFELSPDGKHISVPFEDGRVSVVDVGTGKVEMVQGTAVTGDDKLSTVPAWRSGTELTFDRPTAVGKEEVVVYSMVDKRVRVLSGGWPKEVGDQWLWPKEEAGTKP